MFHRSIPLLLQLLYTITTKESEKQTVWMVLYPHHYCIQINKQELVREIPNNQETHIVKK